MTGDVVKVVQKLNDVTTMQQEDLERIRRQYKLLQETAAIFNNTFKTVFHGVLPERIRLGVPFLCDKGQKEKRK